MISKLKRHALLCRLRRRIAFPGRAALILPPAQPGSLGDQAMLRATLATLRQAGFNRIGILTYDQADRYTIDPDIQHHQLQDYLSFELKDGLMRFVLHAQKYTHFFLIGADVMDGYYSPKETLAKIELAWLAERCGLNTSLLGFSFNAHADTACVDALRTLPTTVAMYARDPVSLARLDQTVGPRAELVADLAFLLRPRESSQVRQYAGWIQGQRNNGRIVIGINANALALPDRGNESSHTLIEGYVAIISHLSEQEGNLSFVLIPHDTRGPHSDTMMAEKLFQGLPDAVAPHVLNASASMVASEIKALCGHLDCLLSGRMHLAIAALGMGIPVACVEYQGKFEGLFQHFGIDGMVLDNTQALSSDSIGTMLRALIKQRHDLARKIKARLPDILNLSMINFSAIADICPQNSAQADILRDNDAVIL